MNITTDNIKVLVEDTGCEEAEARSALELANDNLEQAIINIGVMLKYITAYKAKINLKNENIFGLIHIITNNKNLDLLRFSSVMTYNPVVYEQKSTTDWFSFEKKIYSYRLADGVIEKYTKTIDKNLREFVSVNLKQHKILNVNDMRTIFEEFFADYDMQLEIVAEELTLRDFKKLPNYFPDDIHSDVSNIQNSATIELEAVIFEDAAGKKVENLVSGDTVIATIIDTRDISHYIGHLIGARKEGNMIPMTVQVESVCEKEDEYVVHLRYASLIYGVSYVKKGRILKVLESKKQPWWKGSISLYAQKTSEKIL